jgi:hypothetical protein
MIPESTKLARLMAVLQLSLIQGPWSRLRRIEVHRFVTPIDTTDTVKLHSFAGTRETVLCLGSTYEQIVSKAKDDSLAVNVFKTYVLFSESTDINIMATDDQVISGGSVIFGTNNRTTITHLDSDSDRTGDGISPLNSFGCGIAETFRKIDAPK